MSESKTKSETNNFQSANWRPEEKRRFLDLPRLGHLLHKFLM